MKILYCIPSLSESGGTERIVTQKINFFLEFEKQYDITIVTTEGINKKPFYDLHPSAKVIELNIDFLEEFSKPLYSKYIGTKRKLKEYKKKLIQIINTQNIDICISTGAKELEFLSQIQVPCKKICELHFSKYNRELFFEGKKGGIIWKLIGKIRTYQLIKQTTGLDQLVVLTKKDEKDWKKTHNNVKQIYNFSDIQSESVALLENKKVISVGRLTEQKGYIFLIEAWAIIKNKKSDWTLEIYGEGDLYNELFHQIKDSNLENHVFLKGRTNQVQEKILESSIFALSSRYEGFPMVLLESMACGVPVVSFDCETGPAEIIENNDCGILVENRNVLKLAEALLTMMDDNELRKKRGEVAKVKSAIFSRRKIMDLWMDLFADLTYEN